MASFIAENLATILIGAAVLAAVVFAVYQLVRNRKKGGCGIGGCGSCDARGSCPKAKNDEKTRNK